MDGAEQGASMAEYERSRLVQASPDDVFAFVSDANNLATILPTVETVERQAEDRVEVHGEVRGRTYEDDGWFRVDEARRRIEWGADEAYLFGMVGRLRSGRRGAGGGAPVVCPLRHAVRAPDWRGRRTSLTRSSRVWKRRSTRCAT